MRDAILASDIILWLVRRMEHVSISHVVFKENYFHSKCGHKLTTFTGLLPTTLGDLEAKFAEYDLNIDGLEHVSLSLSRLFRLGHENIHMIRSFIYMMGTHPRGFVKMLKYGASDDW